jgi:hypothetical protein
METLKKEKKITVKFFLNQLVEPAMGEKKEKHYPLYIQVTYNRKNMQFKSKYSLYYKDLDTVKPGLMEFEEKVIRKIITHEVGLTKGEYDLKGLKRKYEVYSTSIMEVLEKHIKPKLRSAIFKTNDELTLVLDFNQPQATVARLYKAAQLLFQDFDTSLTVKLRDDLTAYENYHRLYKEPFFTYTFPTIIDWVDQSYQTELEKKLKLTYKSKPETVKKVMTLIDQAVAENLKRAET